MTLPQPMLWWPTLWAHVLYPDLNVSLEETLGLELVASLDLNLSITLNADTT
ncbi:hypothetical protein PVL29_024131 [Vitis rotundifolia]|uniref:Uncharacterized protein n=1 Tax=Vitis rotundifolia TaxID=103349 RepID=A0AA38YR20_VITRO|nr:hypothetical protein PVL29_024131 [Vitis rotundifolia]